MKFASRMVVFISSLIAPLVYLIFKFDLFSKTEKVKIGYWGNIVLAISVGIVSMLIKYYLDGMKTKYSYLKQILEGCIKVLFPLILGLLLVVWLKDNVDVLIEVLFIFIIFIYIVKKNMPININ